MGAQNSSGGKGHKIRVKKEGERDKEQRGHEKSDEYSLSKIETVSRKELTNEIERVKVRCGGSGGEHHRSA